MLSTITGAGVTVMHKLDKISVFVELTSHWSLYMTFSPHKHCAMQMSVSPFYR